MPNALIYWGPSRLAPHEDIFVAVTGVDSPSDNPKTGPMLQTWIMCADRPPVEAVRSGADQNVCGDCTFRAHGCYVNLRWAPTNIWQNRYRYDHCFTARERQILGCGEGVRLGAYGDPAAVPFEVWGELLAYAKTWAGYTHQWRNGCHPNLKLYCMASVDTPTQQIQAEREGWRTFRVRQERDVLLPGEITCPASDEAGHRTQCLRCRLCEGTTKQAKNIAILPHGTHEHFVNQRTLF